MPDALECLEQVFRLKQIGAERSPNSPRPKISALNPGAIEIRSPVRILRPGCTSASQVSPSGETGLVSRISTRPPRPLSRTP